MNIKNIAMNEGELKRLLDKYYNGHSTDREEMRLRDFFNNENIPEGYEAEKAIFSYFSSPVNIPEPTSGFEERIKAGVSQNDRQDRTMRVRKYMLPFISAAAGLLILFGSYFFLIRKTDAMDTYSDPEIAYAETMKVLWEVSNKLNQGTAALDKVGKINTMTVKSLDTYNRSTAIIKKNLRNLEYLQMAAYISNPSLNK